MNRFDGEDLIKNAQYGMRWAYDVFKDKSDQVLTLADMESAEFITNCFGKHSQSWKYLDENIIQKLKHNHLDTQGHVLAPPGMSLIEQKFLYNTIFHPSTNLTPVGDGKYKRKVQEGLECVFCEEVQNFFYTYEAGIPKVVYGRGPCNSEHIKTYNVNVPTPSKTIAFGCDFRSYVVRSSPPSVYGPDFDITTYINPPPISFYHARRLDNLEFIKYQDLAWIYAGNAEFYIYQTEEGWEIRRDKFFQGKSYLGELSIGSPRWISLFDGGTLQSQLTKKKQKHNPAVVTVDTDSNSVNVEITFVLSDLEDLVCKIRRDC